MPYSNSLNERALLLADRLGILWSDPNPWKVPLEGVEECCGRRGLFVPHAHMSCCSLGQRFRAELAAMAQRLWGEKAIRGWRRLCLSVTLLPLLLQKF